jgi:hypothetical protein
VPGDCPTQGYTFTVEDPTKHRDSLACPSSLTSLAYNPKDENLLAGACHGGQVLWWDWCWC